MGGRRLSVTFVDPQQGKYEVAQAAHQGADNNQ
jgi:hypothetical protein